ncbi:Na/Pi symporter [Bacillus sp. HMF5848]|uniref:Na/Pi symporter n=1 Tax=Bacillus sp. HMF5848 TaxID=2495421 RepID=UPI0028963008|nr:Na/Pi symporter [Bacillus sp. HMF5848]
MISNFLVFVILFIFGMTVMRVGLFNLSANKMKAYLIKFTDNPFKGLITGTIITAILQSSSAVTILTIGLVTAGYITFKQSIGIILGTNIGTTFTTEIITFDLSNVIIPFLVVGTLLMFVPKVKIFSFGAFLFGLGCMFVSMNGFELLAAPISVIPSVQTFLQESNNNSLLAVAIGTVLTAIIQSSTATTGIIMSFLNENILSLSTGIAIVLGANVGTCVTALLASIGASHQAKLTAYTHVWLNVIGVILFFPLIKWFVYVASTLTSFPDVQLAHVSLIFNVLSSIIALPLTGLLATFIIKLHGRTS